MITWVFENAESLFYLSAIIGGSLGLFEWREQQKWMRNEKLDTMIKDFESDAYLRLASVTLDWTNRKTRHLDREIVVRNEDALEALRVHGRNLEEESFPGEQAALRDAYDALLSFFLRLEIALENGLVDVIPAEQYFGYWLERWTKFDRHPANGKSIDGKTPQEAVRAFENAYADRMALQSLRRRFAQAEALGARRARRKPMLRKL